MGMKKSPSEDRFWKKVKKIDKDLCWIWTGGKYYNGYGQFFENPNKITAHRFSYELHNGKIKNKSLLVCHTCDVRSCVNPNHLFLGTHVDNFKDMDSKGRRVKADKSGTKNGRAIINEEDVLKMREIRFLTNLSYKKIGKMFGISETQTARAIKGESWNKV